MSHRTQRAMRTPRQPPKLRLGGSTAPVKSSTATNSQTRHVEHANAPKPSALCTPDYLRSAAWHPQQMMVVTAMHSDHHVTRTTAPLGRKADKTRPSDLTPTPSHTTPSTPLSRDLADHLRLPPSVHLRGRYPGAEARGAGVDAASKGYCNRIGQ